MRLIFVSVICFAASLKIGAQESIINDIDNRLLEKYIDLAKQNFPAKKIADARVDRAQTAVNIASLTWLDLFNVGYYYQPSKSSSSSGNGEVGINTQGQIITQGFMTGITVNLGNLFSKPSMVKAAKTDFTIAKAERDQYDATLKNEVKSRYYAFLLAKRTLEIRTLAFQNYKAIIGDVTAKYQRNEITIDAYTESRNSATESEAQTLAAEVDYLRAKNLMEEIIGKKLEDVK